MEKVRYMISDAADMVHVETHVLRYWEEELELTIPRNEMGHRYYTRENIKEFQRIKDLKDQGYQLKAIRMILHNGKLEEVDDHPMDDFEVNTMEPEVHEAMPLVSTTKQAIQASMSYVPQEKRPVSHLAKQPKSTSSLTPEERMSQFRELMSDIVGQAIAQNNEELSQTIGKDVQELILKEMNYLMREQDNAQEERYRKLDAAIRGSIRKRPLFGKKEKKEK